MAGVSILVLASIIALSTSASPPNLAESFTATGEVEIHTAEGTAIGGKCELYTGDACLQ